MEEQKTVGAIVAEDYRTAVVFKEYGIDFCCGGGRTLSDTCQAKGIPVDQVENALATIQAAPGSGAPDYKNWSLHLLCTYIVEKHHLYVRKMLPQIREFAAKVARVHGERHPEVIEIFGLWETLSQELTTHMMKEENILFPYIREQSLSAESPLQAPFGSVRNPIRVMEIEHETAGSIMAQIRHLSQGYSAPADGCTTYNVLYALLKEFEENLHEHIHLENNILFPRSVEMSEVRSTK